MSTEPDLFEHTRMTLGEHLDELRTRLMRGVFAVGLAFLAAFYMKDEVADFAWQPYYRAVDMINEDLAEEYLAEVRDDPALAREYFEDEALLDPAFVVDEDTVLAKLKQPPAIEKKLITIKPQENFVFVLKICFYASLVVGAPILLYQMWQFVGAGLYAHEKRALLGYFPLSLALFAAGVSFGYLVMVPYGLYFLGTVFSPEVVVNQWTVEFLAQITFSLIMILGVVFQLPVLMVFFCRLGLVEPEAFAKYRKHAIVGAFVLAAFLTPPDPYTQGMMAGPVILLYELGLLLGRWSARPRSSDGTHVEPSA